jgi:hypothetical protein
MEKIQDCFCDGTAMVRECLLNRGQFFHEFDAAVPVTP